MNEITKLDTVQHYCDLFGIEALHPLISIVDCDKMPPIRHGRRLYNLYAILLKDTDCGTMSYGRSIYDYEKGTVLFAAPGQVMGADDDGKLHQPAGWALVFHPELLRGTPLASMMKDYTYFSYNANEALHLSEHERRTITECMEKIQIELQYPIDKHSKSLIVDNIKLLLDYCIRFYDRQFITRENANKDILIPTVIIAIYQRHTSNLCRVRQMIRSSTIQNRVVIMKATDQIVDKSSSLSCIIKGIRGGKNIVINQTGTVSYLDHEVTIIMVINISAYMSALCLPVKPCT